MSISTLQSIWPSDYSLALNFTSFALQIQLPASVRSLKIDCMKTSLRIIAVAVLTSAPAVAQDDRIERVEFAGDQSVATFHDSITGYDTVAYEVAASAGQSMVVVINPSNASTYFNIFEPGQGPGDEAMYAGAIEGYQYQGSLPTAGDYTIQVFLMRNAARRGDSSDYRLDIGLNGGAPEAQVASGDFADGLSGGPDFWQVSVSGSLNVRSAPSTGAPVVVAYVDGTVLRNFGCRDAEGRTWCEVAPPDDDGTRGWAAADFLVESGYVDAVSTDATVDGTPFNATGMIQCAPSADAPSVDCAFGVIRTGNGSGSVEVQWPDGELRTIVFEGGEAVSSDSDEPLSFTRIGGTMNVMIGQEHYEMPDAVIFGG